EDLLESALFQAQRERLARRDFALAELLDDLVQGRDPASLRRLFVAPLEDGFLGRSATLGKAQRHRVAPAPCLRSYLQDLLQIPQQQARRMARMREENPRRDREPLSIL